MDFLSIYAFQNFGIAIIHSLWQIGIICVIYFFLILKRNRQNIKYRYNTGLVSFAIMLIFFVFTYQATKYPNSSEESMISATIRPNISGDLQLTDMLGAESSESQEYHRGGVFNSYNIHSALNKLTSAIGAVWVLGLFFFGFRKVLAYYYLKRIKNNEYNVHSTKWEQVLREISIKLKLKKHVDILFSPLVNSPFSFGFFKPIILFPIKLTTGLSSDEIKCILIHELAHNLRNDYLFNLFQHVIETLFFYHPGVWWMSKQIRIQRELLCDEIVLENKISEKFYANTLLKLGELQLSDTNLAVAAKRNESELLARIKHIVNRTGSSKKRKGNPLLVVGAVLVLIMSGFIIEGKEDSVKPKVLSQEIEESLSSFNGSFVLYDFEHDKYYASNDDICKARYPAYSTFKIASSLMALDMGIANNELYSIAYDSVKHPIPAWMKEHNFFKNWCRDHNIKSALNYSVNWFFNDLGTQIGNENMHDYLEKFAYGNQAVSTNTEQSWYNGQLKISALEQVVFLKCLINQEFEDISKNAQEITMNAIPAENEPGYTIYGKTGTGAVADNKYIGWYVGFIETETNKYAYALNIFANDVNEIQRNKRQELLRGIITDFDLVD